MQMWEIQKMYRSEYAFPAVHLQYEGQPLAEFKSLFPIRKQSFLSQKFAGFFFLLQCKQNCVFLILFLHKGSAVLMFSSKDSGRQMPTTRSFGMNV